MLTAAQAALQEADQRFAGAFYNAPIGMALVAPDGRFLSVNPALCELLARDESELLRTDFQRLTHPDDLGKDLDLASRVLSGDLPSYRLEKRYVRTNGDIVWADLRVSIVRDADGEPAYFVSQLLDITEVKVQQEELRRHNEHLRALARQDGLTELNNRRAFLSAMDREIQRAQRNGSYFSVVLIDLDEFGALNESRGHGAGDEILRGVARVLTDQCRASDLPARVGGDDFAVLLPETDEQGAREAADRVTAAISAYDPALGVALGVASYPDAGETRELLLVRAEMELHASRRPERPARNGANGRVESSADRSDAVQGVLELARDQLRMDLVYLTEHTDSRQIVRAVEGDAEAFGIGTGSSFDLGETFCRHMLAGDLPQTVPDTIAHPLTAASPGTQVLGIRAYAGAPVRGADGRLHGTLCAVDRETFPGLGEREGSLLTFLAGTLAERLDHDEHQWHQRRAAAEVSGLHALLAALTARDHYTSEHSRVVVELAVAVAERLGLGKAEVSAVQQVAVLHDIGKVGIPDAILQKRGELDDAEWEVMRQHPAVGARVLEATSSLAHLAPAIRAEHEHWDGSGYPDGLVGTEIPIASRVALVCDAYHAMTSDRPYRLAMAPAAAREELRKHAGTQFDPNVVALLMDVLEDPIPAVGADNVAPWAADGVHDGVLRGRESSAGRSWAPRTEEGPAGTAGQVRCACNACGAHLTGTLTRANLVGSCPNCGSYDIAPVTL